MNTICSPMTPPECDLRGYEWMPLFGARLFASNFEAHASDLAFRVAIKLYWECWQQVPAASLPNDDVQLCRLAGLGRDIKTWRKLRADGVLHGFRLCSDDRLYHPMLADEAIKAWECRQRQQAERDRERDKKRRQRGYENGLHTEHVPRDKCESPQGRPDGHPPISPGTYPGTKPDVPRDVPLARDKRQDRIGEEREESNKNTLSYSLNVRARGSREQDFEPDALTVLLDEEGIEPPETEVTNLTDILDAREAAREELEKAGAAGAQVRRAAKALAMRIPYAEVRSVDAQLAALQEQPQVVGADAAMGLRWAPAEPVRTVAEQLAAMLAGSTAEQIARAERYAARCRPSP